MEKINLLKEQRDTLVKQMEEALVLLEQTKTIEDKKSFDELELQVEALDIEIASLEKEQVEIKPEIIENTIKEDKKMDKNFGTLIRETVYGTDTGNVANAKIMIPTEIERNVVQKRHEGSIMRKHATIMKASGNSILPVEAGLATAGFGTEISEIVENTPTFDAVEFKAIRCGSLVKISEEAIKDDAFDLEGEIGSQLNRAFATLENSAFVNGTGVGEPTGILINAEVGKAVVDANLKITWDDIEDLYFSLKAEYRTNGVWMMNSKTLKVVKALLTADEAQNVPLTEILGRPVEVNESMPDIGAGAKSILFGDLAYYKVMDRQGMELKVLEELYAVNGIVGFLATCRLDGHLTLPEAVKVLTTKKA